MDVAINQNFAAVGLVKSIRDTHRGGFAGAVLTNDGMNRSRLHDNVYVVVRQNVAEAFCYVS